MPTLKNGSFNFRDFLIGVCGTFGLWRGVTLVPSTIGCTATAFGAFTKALFPSPSRFGHGNCSTLAVETFCNRIFSSEL
jgi:hypothetical protein